MAIACPHQGDGLTRVASFFDPSQDGTWMRWCSLTVTIPSAGFYQTIWQLGGAAFGADPSADTPPFIGEYTDLSAGGPYPYSYADNGSSHDSDDATSIQASGYFHITTRYKASSMEFSTLMNGVQSATPFISDFSAAAVAAEWLGTDVAVSIPGVTIGYDRAFQAWLTESDVAIEMRTRQAVRQTALLADTPLESVADLADLTGNGRAWSILGTPLTVPGPFDLLIPTYKRRMRTRSEIRRMSIPRGV